MKDVKVLPAAGVAIMRSSGPKSCVSIAYRLDWQGWDSIVYSDTKKWKKNLLLKTSQRSDEKDRITV